MTEVEKLRSILARILGDNYVRKSLRQEAERLLSSDVPNDDTSAKPVVESGKLQQAPCKHCPEEAIACETCPAQSQNASCVKKGEQC